MKWMFINHRVSTKKTSTWTNIISYTGVLIWVYIETIPDFIFQIITPLKRTLRFHVKFNPVNAIFKSYVWVICL